ncbi:hypothetical protein D3C80_108920 [compost metagenome]
MGLDWQVATNLGVDHVFNRTDFGRFHCFEMGEVKAQHFVIHQRTFLSNVRPQHIAQGGMHQVRCGVVQTNARTASFIHFGFHARADFQGT